MATLNLTGFEAGDTTELQSLTGTASVQSTTKRTGTYALRCNPTTTAAGWVLFRGWAGNATIVAYNVATVWHRFYFRVGTLPGANSEPIFQARTSTGVTKAEVRITSTGHLQIYNTSIAQLGSDGGTALSTNTWYRIEVKVGTGASASYEVRIDGTTELSGTGDLNATNNGECAFGKISNRNGQTVDFYYDDILISDSDWPGAGACLALKPTANGSTMQWTAGTGSSDFNEVDEIPTDDTSYVQSGGAGQIALFAMQDTGTVGISGSVNCLLNFARTRENATSSTSNFLRLKSGATDSESSPGLNGSTTVVSRGKVYDVDPNTSAAWTLSNIDAIECGSREANASAVRLTTVLAFVDFLAAGGSPSVSPSAEVRCRTGGGR